MLTGERSGLLPFPPPCGTVFARMNGKALSDLIALDVRMPAWLN
jgi:hypothetical protein